jgi:hypothetical protein
MEKEEMDPNYKQNIQEKKQELSFSARLEKGAYVETKISPKQVEAKQGKHPVKNHSIFLC